MAFLLVNMKKCMKWCLIAIIINYYKKMSIAINA